MSDTEAKIELPPEERAAQDFDKLYPVYERLLSNLSRKGAIRVARNLPTYPLIREKIVFQDPKEQEAFELGLHLQDCRLIMMSAVLKEKMMKEEITKEINLESEKTSESADNSGVSTSRTEGIG